MKILDLTFSSPADNLACDEALLDEREASGGAEVLRFWSPRRHFAVLGYSNAAKDEVRPSVPVFRRCSGGGTVLQGPGCLNYSLVLRIKPGGPLDNIRSTNDYVMERQRKAMQALLRQEVLVQGHTDLTLGTMKFSGNAQRRKRGWTLFHGTFLLDFDLARLERSLKMPPKQPAYRQNRPHLSFVTNLEVPESKVKTALKKIWRAEGALRSVPETRIGALAKERYLKKEWTFKF